ncbi:adenosylmethionine--8-amino-7-oxononanoate transaminase [Candidatus Hamiltonella defensa]|uniref:adenosylmethionine--8-amino-7-oxononanoate transaminase n=1 Tax=Candidatus Williamhamiltonella defendens TaxID=138072 RepID=UPI000D60183C|nr:adenosylmethionine--8-amino-7-oxononanoate transaminase [Candidatus Hamiltonella defensa]AWK16465.1 adenosylmethionine--8-amino-7-oxononanoate transaminase [Candidatus Hamiltonella defensa]MBK4361507.1 adenosylmethionine--8-amino-7-oxononanoate transaminase [Candidatus Hamiltonella defensa]
MKQDDLDFDRHHIWHPYTRMIDPLPCYPVKSAQGVELILEDGRRLIDGMSSWWAAIHGYNCRELNQALHQQIEKMSHVMFGGITHSPAIDLCRQLIALTPDPLDCVFLADSGSVSVEVALKMALQYWHAKGERRSKILSFRQGYHGDTFGALSVCDPENSMQALYQGYVAKNLFAPAPPAYQFSEGHFFDAPWNNEEIQSFSQLIETNNTDIAAVILEPIVQGAGGMRIYHPAFLREVSALCERHQILLIADEIATGFGRTGRLFACNYAAIAPDILCLGKALTGGYLTLSATLCTRELANTISKGKAGCFMHGPTFMANPLACAVANANLAILARHEWQPQVKAIEHQLWAELSPLSAHPTVLDVRVLGAIGVIEMKKAVDVASLQREFVAQGVWIRPFGKLIYVMPPYIIRPEQLTQLTQAMAHVIFNRQK